MQNKEIDNNILFTNSGKLYTLKLIGAALDFEVRGYSTYKFEWKKGQRIGKELQFNRRNFITI